MVLGVLNPIKHQRPCLFTVVSGELKRHPINRRTFNSPLTLFGVIINIHINESQQSGARDLFVCKCWAPEQFPRITPPAFIEWSRFIYSIESLRFNWKCTECVASMILMIFFSLMHLETCRNKRSFLIRLCNREISHSVPSWRDTDSPETC